MLILTLLTAVSFATKFRIINSKFGERVSCNTEQLRIIAEKSKKLLHQNNYML